MKKELCCSTDFLDNVFPGGSGHRPSGAAPMPASEHLFSEADIDALMAYCASLGAVRHQWVIGDTNTLYEPGSPLGFDLLRVACAAAHRHGMRFDAVFKPFDAGGYALRGLLPPGLPRPSGTPFIAEPDGIITGIRPFVAAHPAMRLERAPKDTADPGGPVRTIRLVRDGTGDGGPRAGELEILFSRDATGGRVEKYRGPVSFRETLEYRPLLPYRDTGARVITLDGLELPADALFIVIACAAAGETGFANRVTDIAELLNPEGRLIPAAPAPGPLPPEMIARCRKFARLGLDRFLSAPEVKAILDDGDTFEALCADMNRLRSVCGPAGNQTEADYRPRLEKGSRLVLRRGKPRHIRSALSPVYPEVRAHWLERVRFCVERGVDGVIVRTQGHNWPVDPWAYGFNPPALAAAGGSENSADVARANGEAYTLFMRETAGLLHAAGREMGVQVYTTMLGADDRPGAWHAGALVPRNIEYQWRTWIAEIADFVEFRGAFTMRPENIRRAVDLVGLAAREAGKPFTYQSSRAGGVVSFDGPHDHLAWEIENIVRDHPDVSAYNLYETAAFTRFDARGRFEGSAPMAALVKRLWRVH